MTNGTILSGDDAIKLWLQGRDAWNSWVEDHLYWGVGFDGVDFSRIDTTKNVFNGYNVNPLNHNISFEEFKFPNGNVSFNNTIFGKVDVNFEGAEFRDSRVFFGHQSFPEVKFNFKNVKFENGSFVLKGYAAIELRNLGRNAWNKWVEDHLDWSVDFSMVEFEIKSPNEKINFVKFKFPNGGVSFLGAIFKGGLVDFTGATFGDGYVSFERAIFKDDPVNFTLATFGGGNVSFKDAKFGDGTVDFTSATFGDGYVDFTGTEFGNGSVDFRHATFGNGDVTFAYAKCNGTFDFSPEDTSDIKKLSFFGCTFKGVMILAGTYTCVPDLRNTITSSHVDLSGLKIDKEYKKLISDTINFDVNEKKDEWVGKLKNILHNHPILEYAEKITSIKAKIKAAFPEKKWEKSVKKWNEEVEKNSAKDPKNILPKTLINKYKEKSRRDNIEKIAAQFCRLKELAEQNRAHDRALDFFAEECRMGRGWRRPAHSFLDWLYGVACRHGRSIGRPVAWLLVSWVVFSGVYYRMSSSLGFKSCFKLDNVSPECGDAVLLTIMNSVPFLGFTRYGYDKTFENVFGSNPSWDAYAWVGAQSLIAFIFLFLIGLGIRNRFRI